MYVQLLNKLYKIPFVLFRNQWTTAACDYRWCSLAERVWWTRAWHTLTGGVHLLSESDVHLPVVFTCWASLMNTGLVYTYRWCSLAVRVWWTRAWRTLTGGVHLLSESDEHGPGVHLPVVFTCCASLMNTGLAYTYRWCSLAERVWWTWAWRTLTGGVHLLSEWWTRAWRTLTGGVHLLSESDEHGPGVNLPVVFTCWASLMNTGLVYTCCAILMNTGLDYTYRWCSLAVRVWWTRAWHTLTGGVHLLNESDEHGPGVHLPVVFTCWASDEHGPGVHLPVVFTCCASLMNTGLAYTYRWCSLAERVWWTRAWRTLTGGVHLLSEWWTRAWRTLTGGVHLLSESDEHGPGVHLPVVFTCWASLMNMGLVYTCCAILMNTGLAYTYRWCSLAVRVWWTRAWRTLTGGVHLLSESDEHGPGVHLPVVFTCCASLMNTGLVYTYRWCSLAERVWWTRAWRTYRWCSLAERVWWTRAWHTLTGGVHFLSEWWTCAWRTLTGGVHLLCEWWTRAWRTLTGGVHLLSEPGVHLPVVFTCCASLMNMGLAYTYQWCSLAERVWWTRAWRTLTGGVHLLSESDEHGPGVHLPVVFTCCASLMNTGLAYTYRWCSLAERVWRTLTGGVHLLSESDVHLPVVFTCRASLMNTGLAYTYRWCSLAERVWRTLTGGVHLLSESDVHLPVVFTCRASLMNTGLAYTYRWCSLAERVWRTLTGGVHLLSESDVHLPVVFTCRASLMNTGLAYTYRWCSLAERVWRTLTGGVHLLSESDEHGPGVHGQCAFEVGAQLPQVDTSLLVNNGRHSRSTLTT